MKDITENELDEVEIFVKTELEQRLLEKCTRSNTEMSAIEKEHFFGLYASSAGEFKLLRGERKLLMKIASYLTELYAKGDIEFKTYFEIPKRFKFKNDITTGAAGLFYGKKCRKQTSYAEYTPDDLMPHIVAKLKPFFESFKNLKPLRPITQDLVKIVDLKNGYRADVICVFCPSNVCDIEVLLKRIAVQWDGVWNFTNFRKHIVNIHTKGNKAPPTLETNNSFEMEIYDSLKINVGESTANESIISVKKEFSPDMSEQFDEVIDASNIEKLPIQFDDSYAEEKSLRSLMFDQFTEQNIRLIESVLRFKEVKKHVSVKIDGRLVNFDVLKIHGDGNCLFAAFVHQIHLVRINSNEHKVFTIELRQKVVNHIEENFERYIHPIKGRIIEEYELKNETAPDITVDACTSFVARLAKPNDCWGGAETIQAVSEIHKVNVVVFNEKGDLYFPRRFDKIYKRTVFLAFRLSQARGKSGRLHHNHYDSVCTIKDESVYKFATFLASK